MTTLLLTSAALLLAARGASAQDPPPRIGPFVLDIHGVVPRFPDEPQLADSRGVTQGELPRTGLGLHGGAHLYVLKLKAITFGVGVDATRVRARRGVQPLGPGVPGRAVTEDFTHVAPELSFNFGNGNGWSYLSGGIGPGIWSLIPEGSGAIGADVERLQTINYGGGARWFMKRHLAFSFDVRFYAINPSTPDPAVARPASPRTTLLFVGGGISLK
jgi:hypothetical protein